MRDRQYDDRGKGRRRGHKGEGKCILVGPTGVMRLWEALGCGRMDREIYFPRPSSRRVLCGIPQRRRASMTLRAVIYARYSSENQREASLEDQVRLCRERIAAERWELVQVFQDRATSGASSLRAGYQALLAGARDGAFDVVVAEALDRLSRDQEDVAALFKRMRFAGVRIFTLSEGEVSELHVGLKGTMNALFLKDLAAKTRRGLRGRVEAGKSAGGNSYGYRVVRQVGPDGGVTTGDREIKPAEAAVIERIFHDYAAGVSPKRIAMQLNAEGIPAPRGGKWSASTINGNRARGTGILNNTLYIGQVVWNRLGYTKDPDTGRRRSRPHPDKELITKDAPDRRIVSPELWDRAKARQAGLDHRRSSGQRTPAEPGAVPFWSKQRPRYLFSGLMRCGQCGGGFSKMSDAHFGCSTARNKGPTACTNRTLVRRDALEETVLGALRERLMDPDLFRVFAAEFVAEWNRLQAAASGDQEGQRAELEQVRRQIDRLVDAIAEGTPASRVKDKLGELETRRLHLEAQLEAAVAPAPRLHPNLAEVYRQRVHDLSAALAQEDAAEARDIVRGLVETIKLIPEDGRLRIEVRGELGAILSLAEGARNAQSPRLDAGALGEQIKMVAGIGFEPMTFRL
jgi:site-specific DNA recombinase